MKTTSYGKTKQHLFVGLLLGVIVLSTQAQALSIEQAPIGQAPICCSAYDAQCESCKQGLSEKEYCRKNPYVTGCEKYNCCKAFTADCQSCAAGLSEEEYCKKNPSTSGCEKYNCCSLKNAFCNSCKEGISLEEYCKKSLPSVPAGCKREGCCQAFTASCRACHRGVSKEEFCKRKPKVPGCERNFRDCKKDPSASGCKWIKCCVQFTSKCFACTQDKSEEEFCKAFKKFGIPGC